MSLRFPNNAAESAWSAFVLASRHADIRDYLGEAITTQIAEGFARNHKYAKMRTGKTSIRKAVRDE